MSSRKSSWISVVTFLLYFYQDQLIQAKIHFVYMTNYCSKSLQVEDSLIMALTSPGSLPLDRDRDFVHCDVDLVAPPGMRLFIHFLQLGISPNVDHPDRVHLFDVFSNNTRLTPKKGIYGKLDRTLSLFDGPGIQVNDYRTASSKMKVDYLGKISVKSPGFRLLITTFQDPSFGGDCPVRHYLCRHSWICIPLQVACDGNPNCGKDDGEDEKECDEYNTVTNLLAEYSLSRDIIVAILLPLAVFIAIVICIFMSAKRYIRQKINSPVLPVVHFTPKRDGQVRFAEETQTYAPPPYDLVLELPKRYDPPPAYNGLSFLVLEDCSKVLSSENEIKEIKLEQRDKRRKELEQREIENAAVVVEEDENCNSGEKICENTEYEHYRLHCVWPSDTEDDDEEMKAKRRRKGGKGKIKGKRKESSNMEARKNVLKQEMISGKKCSSDKNSKNSFDNSNTSSVADSLSATASSPDLPQSFESSSSTSISRHPVLKQSSPSTEDSISVDIHSSKSEHDVIIPFPDEILARCRTSNTACTKIKTTVNVLELKNDSDNSSSNDGGILCNNNKHFIRSEKPHDDFKKMKQTLKDSKSHKLVVSSTIYNDEDADVSSDDDDDGDGSLQDKNNKQNNTIRLDLLRNLTTNGDATLV